MVKSDSPGTFVVRNSGSFPYSFGLVMKIDTGGSQDESDHVVRHYLIEGMGHGPQSSNNQTAVGIPGSILSQTTVPVSSSALSVVRGWVRLRGSSSEPIFINLISLLYEHMIQPLALPCSLRMPFKNPLGPNTTPSSLIHLFRQHLEHVEHLHHSQQQRHQPSNMAPQRYWSHGGYSTGRMK